MRPTAAQRLMMTSAALGRGAARVNLFTDSRNLSAWGGGGANHEIVSDATTSSFGDSLADRLQSTNTATSARFISQTPTEIEGETYTQSIRAKRDDYDWVWTTESSHGELRISYFDILNGVTGTVNANHTPAIVDLGDGWFLVSITHIVGSTVGASRRFGIASADNVISFAGTAGAGTFLDQAQLNLGSEVGDPIFT